MTRYTKIRDFHGSRAQRIGSSDIPTLLLYNKKWGDTPYTLWEEKTGRREGFSGNSKTWWGNQLEGLILRQWVRDHYGPQDAEKFYRQYLSNRSHRNLATYTEASYPGYPWTVAHADLVDTLRETIVEAKSHGLFAAQRKDDVDEGYDREDRGAEGIPAKHFVQTQWQMLCYQAPRAELCALIDTNDYREYGPILGHKKTQEDLLAVGERFMWHVDNDVPPKPETWADVVSMFPDPEDTQAVYPLDYAIDDGKSLQDMLIEREKLAARSKKDKDRLDDIKNAVGILIGENKVLATPEGHTLATTYTVDRESVSGKKIREADPELWEKMKADGYVSESSNRMIKFRKLKLT